MGETEDFEVWEGAEEVFGVAVGVEPFESAGWEVEYEAVWGEKGDVGPTM